MSTRDEQHLFDETVVETRKWIAEIADEMRGVTLQTARHALRGVLFALRERTPTSETMDLAAQLPVLLRGLFFEGYRGSPRLQKNRNVQAFLDHVATELLPTRDEGRVLDAVRAVLTVLGRHVTAGELRQVRDVLPAEIRALWPEELIPPEDTPQSRPRRPARAARRPTPRTRHARPVEPRSRHA